MHNCIYTFINTYAIHTCKMCTLLHYQIYCKHISTTKPNKHIQMKLRSLLKANIPHHIHNICLPVLIHKFTLYYKRKRQWHIYSHIENMCNTHVYTHPYNTTHKSASDSNHDLTQKTCSQRRLPKILSSKVSEPDQLVIPHIEW